MPQIWRENHNQFLLKKQFNKFGTVPVPCDSLERILHGAGQPGDIDFLSLDVEGSEEHVLATIDPARFKLIVYEANLLTSAARDRIHEKLLRAGHAPVRQLVPWGSLVYARLDASAAEKFIPGSCRVAANRELRVPDCTAFSGKRAGETSRRELWEALSATLPPKRSNIPLLP